MRYTALRWLTPSALVLFVSCGGGGSGGVAPGASNADLVGQWNLFLDGITCDSNEFRALPLEIVLNGSDVSVLIGEPGDEYTYTATVVGGDTLEITGTAANSESSIEITSASLDVLDGENRLDGMITFEETIDGQVCTFTGTAQAFRQDATQTAAAAGPWRWTGDVTDASGPCTTVGDIQILDVMVYPKRANEFFVAVRPGDGGEVQFDGTFDGTDLALSGMDDTEQGTAELLSGSSIAIDSVGARGNGMLSIRTTEGIDTCTFILTINALRGSSGRSYLPFVADVRGSGAIMGIDPEDPTNTRTFTGALGPDGGPEGQELGRIDRLTEIVDAPIYDRNSRQVTGHRQDALYYADGGRLHRQDLAIRIDATGARVDTLPELILEVQDADITDIEMFTEFGGEDAVMMLQTRSTFSPEEDGTRFLVAVDQSGDVRSAPLQPLENRVVGLILDDAGRFREAVLLPDFGQQFLVKFSFENPTELLDNDAREVSVSPTGLVAFSNGMGELRVHDGDTGQTTTVQSGTTDSFYSLAPYEGDTLYATQFSTLDGATTLFRVDGSAAGTTTLATEMLTPAEPFDPLLAPTHVVPTVSHVLVRYRGGLNDTRWFSYPRGGGSGVEIAGSFGGAQIEEIRVAGNRIFTDQTNSSTFLIDATDTLPTGFLDGGSIAGSIDDESYSIDELRDSNVIAFRGESGGLNVLFDPARADGFVDLVPLISPSIPGSRLQIGVRAGGFVVADRLSSQAPSADSEIYYLEPESDATPILVRDVPGDLDLPVR